MEQNKIIENTNVKKKGLFWYCLLFFAVGIYSCCSLCNKLAAAYPVLSWKFILLYGCSLFILAVYAVLWQFVLKHFDLSVAYSAKPLSTLLSMVWGVALFHESINWKMIVGAVIILIGMRLVVTDHE